MSVIECDIATAESIIDMSQCGDLSYIKGLLIQLMLDSNEMRQKSNFLMASSLLHRHIQHLCSNREVKKETSSNRKKALFHERMDEEPEWMSLSQGKPNHCEMCYFLVKGNESQANYRKGIYLNVALEDGGVNEQGRYGVFFDGFQSYSNNNVSLWKGMLRDEEN